GLRFFSFGRPQSSKQGIAASAFSHLGGHNLQNKELRPPLFLVWEATISEIRNCGLRFFSFGRPQSSKQGIAASALSNKACTAVEIIDIFVI
ncbi:MAG: hypothetical protein J5584_03910, partial [Clostridia bacterium]|nr:hypothetical protein [Clostridia bacterium]